MDKKVKKMVGIGMFTAIVVVLQFVAVGLRTGNIFAFTPVLVPIVVGTALYGVGAGAWLGAAFGVTVLISGDANAFLTVNFWGTIATVMVKGIACGWVAGLVYTLLKKYSKVFAVYAAAIICPIVNTGIFLIGCRLFFFETVAGWAADKGFTNATTFMFLGLAGINFLAELGSDIVLAPVITRLIKIGQKN